MLLASDVIGAVTLALVCLLCLTGGHCVVYVLRFHFKVRREQQPALRDFDSPWLVRILLISFAVLWGLAELLRLSLFRRLGWLGFAWQANLCRVYVVSSIGFLEPGFFLTALFLIHGSLHNFPFVSRSISARVSVLVLLFCLPSFLLQLTLVLTSTSFQFHRSYSANREGFGSALPHYFTRSFERNIEHADTPLALCTYPLFSVLVLGLFFSVFVFYFTYLGIKMLHLVINRKLQIRVYGLVLMIIFLLPLHVIFLGVSAHMDPSETTHDYITFFGFLSLLLCTFVGEGILVLQPIADALAVRLMFESRYNRLHSFHSSPMEPFGRQLSPFVSDEEESEEMSTERSSKRALPNILTNGESSVMEASVSFDVMLQDMPLSVEIGLGDVYHDPPKL